MTPRSGKTSPSLDFDGQARPDVDGNPDVRGADVPTLGGRGIVQPSTIGRTELAGDTVNGCGYLKLACPSRRLRT